MILKCKTPLLLIALLFIFVACKKGNVTPEEPNPEIVAPIVPPPTTTPPPPTDIPTDATFYDLGTGKGDLVVDGTTLNFVKNSVVRIKGGTYNSILIKNINATESNPLLIKNDGLVMIKTILNTDNVNNLTISGDNVANLTYGFQFEDIAFRAISMNGKMNGVTIKNISFKNVADYVIAGEKSNGDAFPYNGSAESRTERFKVIYCKFDNTGPISFGGNLNKGNSEDSGLFKDVEIAYNSFSNTDAGTLCSFTNVQDYNIHHNTVDNVNQNNNNHNGIFYMQGNGKFHDNKLTNYQGNSIRMWLYSRGNTPVTVEIYNNLCYNTRKYGGFELQAFDRNMYPGKSTYANAKVYNNTVGRMNTSQDFEGQILDLYQTGGTLEYYNNLGFDLNSKKTIGNMINNMGDTKIIVESNNKYSANWESAVSDTKNFASKFPGVGMSGI
ncbi:hypothetical protein SAMN04487898_103273 [Pedobacter sp. ok626]|uniref:hypothetical protein n=1 Tax=Pedobacter sp. ok626 TaxID=1761882 RepID=UPI00088CEC4F|nr:hypothetical protein [Pedobacter sp. ok626]SDJ56608.1 hypothetical protein SAMN04487898_103273 [Pedobacter sp. ok626]